MNLYEINQAILNCFVTPKGDVIDMDTGELLDTQYLDNLKMARDEKIENIVLFIKNSLSNAEQIKNEMQSLDKRMKVEKNRAERLKNYLDEVLCGETFETAKCKCSYRKSQQIEVSDGFVEWAKENAEEFLKFKEPDVDKARIKDAIKSGSEFEFAKIVDKYNLQIK